MNPGSITLLRAANVLTIIRDLEEEEERYITLFRIQSPCSNSSCIFDAGLGHQNERARLYTVRLQIYACSVAFKYFLDDIEQPQPQKQQNQCAIVARAREMRIKLFQTMMKRRDGLLVEKRTYELLSYAPMPISTVVWQMTL
ncbi:hypothetical protein BGX24_010278 [Mortierella sp. AD032]|nr:hypothetical protein BGX24_010278 [Mortierella sp. AD032]